MAKSKAEKIADIELQMTQLENQRKKLLQQQKEQERTERKKRLCKRMGLFERLLPETVQLTDEQFKTFLEQTAAAESGRRLLDELTAQSTATGAAIHAGGTAQADPQPSPSPARTGPQSGAGADRAGGAGGAD
jgi:hypothetical protein